MWKDSVNANVHVCQNWLSIFFFVPCFCTHRCPSATLSYLSIHSPSSRSALLSECFWRSEDWNASTRTTTFPRARPSSTSTTLCVHHVNELTYTIHKYWHRFWSIQCSVQFSFNCHCESDSCYLGCYVCSPLFSLIQLLTASSPWSCLMLTWNRCSYHITRGGRGCTWVSLSELFVPH